MGVSFGKSDWYNMTDEVDPKMQKCLTQSTSGWNVSDEEKEAYCYAYIRDITTQDVEHVNWNGKITRAELAKMMVNYKVTLIGGEPQHSPEECRFQDGKIWGDLENYIMSACIFWIMGQDGNGGVNPYFEPHKTVSRAEFATVLSRVLFGDTFNQTEENKPYYEKHLEALHHYEVINTPDATIQEKRGWIMLMLLRAGNALKIYEDEIHLAKKEAQPFTDNVDIILSFDDKIEKNTIWCGTFQLVRNALMEYFNLDKIELRTYNTPLTEEVVDHLNQKSFSTDSLSDSGYYLYVWEKDRSVKQKIIQALQEKFNEKSDILNTIDWSDWFLSYVMLKKDFHFEHPFSEIPSSDQNVYFWIHQDIDKALLKQVDVLFYEDREHFAVKLNTQEKEDVILVRGIEEDSFKEIYQALQEKIEDYTGNKAFTDEDSLKVPNIDVKLQKQITGIDTKAIGTGRYAMQTIEFFLDRFGGKVKSEAYLSADKWVDNPRYFHFDDDFVLFLKESDKEVPYLAVYVSDIDLFQRK